MVFEPSRRSFLAAAAALPGVAAQAAENQVSYRVLGKTGLKVTTVGFGSMITSDPSVIARALELGITYFDTARGYQNGNNERMVGAALKGRRKDIVSVEQVRSQDGRRRFSGARDQPKGTRYRLPGYLVHPQ